MAIGPGVLAVAAVLLVLLLLAVIGLVSGGDEGGGGKSARKADTTGQKKRSKQRGQAKKQAAAPAAPASTVKVKIVPTEPTYLCVDDGHRTIFEATITSAHSFRKKRVRVNLGRPSAKIFVNGELFRYREGAEAVGFSFSRTGRGTRLPLGDRPCA